MLFPADVNWIIRHMFSIVNESSIFSDTDPAKNGRYQYAGPAPMSSLWKSELVLYGIVSCWQLINNVT